MYNLYALKKRQVYIYLIIFPLPVTGTLKIQWQHSFSNIKCRWPPKLQKNLFYSWMIVGAIYRSDLLTLYTGISYRYFIDTRVGVNSIFSIQFQFKFRYFQFQFHYSQKVSIPIPIPEISIRIQIPIPEISNPGNINSGNDLWCLLWNWL